MNKIFITSPMAFVKATASIKHCNSFGSSAHA